MLQSHHCLRWAMLISIAALASSACDGVLKEKVGQSDVDASVLTTIPPPACTDPDDAAGRHR